MSKNDDILSQIGGMYILYKLRWVILIGIIIFGVVIFFVNGDLDNEYQQYGYNGFSDNIKYDEWTDEIIPKNKIETYNNDNKYITKSNGDKVYFADIKQQLTAYEELQGDYAFIKADNVDKCKSICDVLFLNYFELSYSIDKISDGNSYLIHLKDFTANGMHYDDYSIGPAYEMRSTIKYLVKGIYREQNGLEADYGY